MNKLKYIIGIISISLLAGCADSGYSDIKDWMKEETKNSKGRIEPLPEARTFVPVVFKSVNDPFKDKPLISISSLNKDKYAPDPNRRKEPLEQFSLEQLKITGTIKKDGRIYALIKTPDNMINYVTVSNYIGTNYGQIVFIDESVIKIKERVKDADEWKLKDNHISID